MHLSEVNEAMSHRINGGSEYQWHCWDNARFLDYESDYAHASVVFNCETQEIYCAEINDKEDKHKPYRWLNPSYKNEYFDEAKERNIDPDQAWDDKKWYDLEVKEDWLEKAEAIFNGESFDDRVKVPLDLSRDELFKLMEMAHERDITLNQMVEEILWQVINQRERNKIMEDYPQDVA